MAKYVLALDQGTTSSRAIIFDEHQTLIGKSQKCFKQIFPEGGYVEHDPNDILSSQLGAIAEVMESTKIAPRDIVAIGITNQRETTILWDKNTGEPVYNAIVWQCRRTAGICDKLKANGYENLIRKKTGLLLDAYFSATKIQWILDNVDGVRERAENGDILFGTVDTYLAWKLTDGKVHITDFTNASRTMLFNIHTLEWDAELCSLFNIPMRILPEVVPSSKVYATTKILGVETPIAALVGDQQSALFGHHCFDIGDCKNTYGTGCFMLMNTGETAFENKEGLLVTIVASTDNRVRYALEGSVFVGGAIVQWLRDEMKMIEKSSDMCKISMSVPDNGGVYVVPAFTGLGAPHWDMYARGSMFGITRGTTKEHVIRAASESTAFQSHDLLKAIEKASKIKINSLNVDGGASEDDFLMQFQSDISGIPVVRPRQTEITALGAALLAGIATGVWENFDELKQTSTIEKVFMPEMSDEKRNFHLTKWNTAIRCCKMFK